MALVDDLDPSISGSCFVIDSILSYYTDMSNRDQDTESTSPSSTTDYMAIEDIGSFPLPPSTFNPKTHNLFMMSPSSKRIQASDRVQTGMKDITNVSETAGTRGNDRCSNQEL